MARPARPASPVRSKEGTGKTGQGSYQVNPQVTSFHNLRAAPSLFSPIVGNLEAYDVVEVSQTIRLLGESTGPEVWAQIWRSSAGPAIWTLQSDVEHVYLRKLTHSGDEETPPKSWTGADELQDPYGEAAQSLNFLLAASLGSPDSKKVLESVADHELQLGCQSAAVKELEAEASKLRAEALGYEQELQQRSDKRAETLRNVRRLKQREAWTVACAQTERLTMQAHELLEDAVDDAEAMLQAQLLHRAKAEDATGFARKKRVGRLGRQLMASIEGCADSAEDSKLDNKLVEAMTSLDTMLGQRYLERGKSVTDTPGDEEFASSTKR